MQATHKSIMRQRSFPMVFGFNDIGFTIGMGFVSFVIPLSLFPGVMV